MQEVLRDFRNQLGLPSKSTEFLPDESDPTYRTALLKNLFEMVKKAGIRIHLENKKAVEDRSQSCEMAGWRLPEATMLDFFY